MKILMNSKFLLKKKSALAKAPRATKPANIQTIPAKGKKANVDSSEESADGDELPMVTKNELLI
jgi:hypothetical protein